MATYRSIRYFSSGCRKIRRFRHFAYLSARQQKRQRRSEHRQPRPGGVQLMKPVADDRTPTAAYTESNIFSQRVQVPFFSHLTLTFIFKVKHFHFILFIMSRRWRKIEQTLLLPLYLLLLYYCYYYSKSCICHRIVPLRMYTVTLTCIFMVKKCELLISGKR